MRKVSKQKRPIAFISGNPAFFYARYLLKIVSSKTSFKPSLPFGFFPDLLNKFKKKSRETSLIAPVGIFSAKVIFVKVTGAQGKIFVSFFSAPLL